MKLIPKTEIRIKPHRPPNNNVSITMLYAWLNLLVGGTRTVLEAATVASRSLLEAAATLMTLFRVPISLLLVLLGCPSSWTQFPSTTNLNSYSPGGKSSLRAHLSVPKVFAISEMIKHHGNYSSLVTKWSEQKKWVGIILCKLINAAVVLAITRFAFDGNPQLTCKLINTVFKDILERRFD